jgi:transposase
MYITNQNRKIVKDVFDKGMPTKVTIELIMDNEAFYESGTNENIENYIIEIQKLAKTFSYVRECNIVSIVREGGR